MNFTNIIIGSIGLVILFLILLYLLFLLMLLVRGAPFVPSYNKTIEKMIALADVKPGEMAVDLGSGDGKVVIALAQAGALAHGYEINPLLVYLSRRKIHKAGLEGKAFVHWKDFWHANLSSFDIVAIFGISHIMRFLKKKLQRELKPGARVISNAFVFPKWPYVKAIDAVYLYKK